MLQVATLSINLVHAFAAVHMVILRNTMRVHQENPEFYNRHFDYKQCMEFNDHDEGNFKNNFSNDPHSTYHVDHWDTGIPKEEGNNLFIIQARCSDVARYQFLVDVGQGQHLSRIRPALRPDLCVEAPEKLLRPSLLGFKPCSGSANQSFILSKPGTGLGHICMASSPDLCIGAFHNFEYCVRDTLLAPRLGYYPSTVLVGIGNVTISDKQRPYPTPALERNTLNYVIVAPWEVITAHPDMWLGNRVTEAIAFKILMYSLTCCAVIYAAYLFSIVRRCIVSFASTYAHTSWLWKTLAEAKSMSNRVYQALLALCGIRSSSSDFIRLMEIQRLQRAQVHCRRLVHIFSIYAIYKAYQCWQDYQPDTECVDLVSACNPPIRSLLYGYETVPMFLMAYPASILLSVLGDRIRPWLCDMIIRLLYVGWLFRSVIDHKPTYETYIGHEIVKIFCCRLGQLFVLGNPRLAATCEVLVYFGGIAYSYAVCSGFLIRDPGYGCPDSRTEGKRLELFVFCFAAGCMHVFDSVQVRTTVARRKEEARELALRLLQSHLDVLYDCVVHLGESFEILAGVPKFAGLLVRGSFGQHPLRDRYIVDLIAAGDKRRFVEHMRSASHSDNVTVLHVSFVDGNGDTVPCELFTSSATGADGGRTYLLGIKEIEREIVAPSSVQGEASPNHLQRLRIDGVEHIDAFSVDPLLSGTRDQGTIDQSLSAASGTDGEIASEAMGPSDMGYIDSAIDGDNACDVGSVSSMSSSSGTLDSTTGGNLWLHLFTSTTGHVCISQCSRALELVLGEDVVGKRLETIILNKKVFQAWLQKAVNHPDRFRPSCKVILNRSRWRPMCMSAIFSFKRLDVDNRIIHIHIQRIRYDSRLGGPSVAKQSREHILNQIDSSLLPLPVPYNEMLRSGSLSDSLRFSEAGCPGEQWPCQMSI